MDWVWTRVAAVSVTMNLLSLAAAALVFGMNPGRLQNRLLALSLTLAALASMCGSGLMYATRDPAEAYAFVVVAFVLVIPGLAMYLAFVSTLATPLARPLAWLRPGLYAFALVAPVVYLLAPQLVVGTIVPGTFAPWNNTGGPLASVVWGAQLLANLLGFAFAISAYRRAPAGTLARVKARAYLLAFGLSDASAIVIVSLALRNGFTEGLMIALALVTPVFVVLLGYGILTTQLFDIDLRIKRSLRRGTVAGVFVAAFFVAAAIAEQWLQQYGLVIGGVAVGLLLFALRPLERVAARLSDQAMPNVNSSPAYLAYRKMEVYKAAVEEIVADGSVSEKDRRILDRLRAQLGLTTEDAWAMERDLVATRGATVGLS